MRLCIYVCIYVGDVYLLEKNRDFNIKDRSKDLQHHVQILTMSHHVA